MVAGNHGANALQGGAGIDMFFGNNGADNQTGGADSDTFHFSSIFNSLVGAGDTITDFDATDGAEDMVFHSLLSGAFNFLGASTNAFTAIGNTEARFNDATDLLSIDINGNGNADMEMTLTGVSLANLGADDFSFV